MRTASSVSSILAPALRQSARHSECGTYAVLARDDAITVAIINREAARYVTIQLDVTRYFKTGTVLRLEAPSLTAKSDVTFEGASVSKQGSWTAASNEVVARDGRLFTVKTPYASAAVIRFEKGK